MLYSHAYLIRIRGGKNHGGKNSAHEDEGFLEFDKRLLESFPAGAINAKLIGNDKTEVMLTYEGASLTNKESTMLSLYSEGGVPTDIEFNKVVVTSNIELKDIKIYWKNFKH